MTRANFSRFALLVLATTAALGLAGRAEAHHRDFTFIRDWFLPYQGEQEFESRTTYVEGIKSFDQEFEYEYGVNNHMAIEPGIALHQDNGGKLHIDAWDAELRMNFGEFAFNKVLPALNVEYEDPSAQGEPSHGELKFIFSYYTEAGEDYSLNLNIGQELSGPKEKEGEALFGYARPIGPHTEGAVGYQLGWRGGFESAFDFQEHFMAAGPVVIFRARREFNALLTALMPLNHSGEQHTVLKLIMEYEFD